MTIWKFKFEKISISFLLNILFNKHIPNKMIKLHLPSCKMYSDRRENSDDDVENVSYCQVPDKHHGDAVQAEYSVLERSKDNYQVSAYPEHQGE